jgi:hypothetical protein
MKGASWAGGRWGVGGGSPKVRLRNDGEKCVFGGPGELPGHPLKMGNGVLDLFLGWLSQRFLSLTTITKFLTRLF